MSLCLEAQRGKLELKVMVLAYQGGGC